MSHDPPPMRTSYLEAPSHTYPYSVSAYSGNCIVLAWYPWFWHILTLICDTPFSALVCPGSRVRSSSVRTLVGRMFVFCSTRFTLRSFRDKGSAERRPEPDHPLGQPRLWTNWPSEAAESRRRLRSGPRSTCYDPELNYCAMLRAWGLKR